LGARACTTTGFSVLLLFILGGLGNLMAIFGTRTMVKTAKKRRGNTGE
jgi:hypothetical protein